VAVVSRWFLPFISSPFTVSSFARHSDDILSDDARSGKVFALYNTLPTHPHMLSDRDKIIRESLASVTAYSSCGDLPCRSVHPPPRHGYGLQYMEKG
jgi:hypothetical protein